MIEIAIPGFGSLALEVLICDFNGTLARDGKLLTGVSGRLLRLARSLRVQVVTADTFGTARRELRTVPAEIVVIGTEHQAEAKLEIVRGHGVERVAAIGNGRNDRLMLAEAALGIGVLGEEGLAGDALAGSDAVVRDIRDALDLLLKPQRLVATLRS
jgi:soluble P-type ATPase